jgi:hypothetical protein
MPVMVRTKARQRGCAGKDAEAASSVTARTQVGKKPAPLVFGAHVLVSDPPLLIESGSLYELDEPAGTCR